MKDKEGFPNREANRRGPMAVQDHERIPGRKSKAVGPQHDRDRDSPLSGHRSMAIRPHERERDRDRISYHEGRSSHASKSMSSEEAQKTIRTLFMQVKETMSFFANFKEEYQREVRDIEIYAGQTILEKLWERKTKKNDSKSRSNKGRSKDDGICSEFDDASTRLWDSLNDAYEGARSHSSSQNDSMARKLGTAIKDVGELLMSVRNKFQDMDSLIKELKVLKMVLELDGAGKASHDDRANRRPRARAASHAHPMDPRLGGEDARYGGMGEDSGVEDDDQRDEQHSEHSEQFDRREEREVSEDDQGQGPFPTDQSI